jgi:hypothetical protein
VFRYGEADPAAIVHEPAQAFSNGSATMTFPAYSITEFVVPASGLAPAVAHLRRATSTATTSVPVPAARPGPADGFLRATGFDGRKVADGWNPKAWDPPTVRPSRAHQASMAPGR